MNKEVGPGASKTREGVLEREVARGEEVKVLCGTLKKDILFSFMISWNWIKLEIAFSSVFFLSVPVPLTWVSSKAELWRVPVNLSLQIVYMSLGGGSQRRYRKATLTCARIPVACLFAAIQSTAQLGGLPARSHAVLAPVMSGLTVSV